MARVVMDAGSATSQFERTLKGIGRPMIRKIVEAGAGAAEKRMRENIVQRQHIKTGDMMDAVGNNGIREYLGGARTDVYPQGTDRKGVRNATKAYVINYGKGRKITGRKHANRTGDKFITGDDAEANRLIAEAMIAESDRLFAEADKA